MRDMQEARDKIADGLWWLRGFAAANHGDAVAADLAEKLRSVHAYLADVQCGEVRRLGEETAVVLTYPEFERLIDAVRVPRPQEIKSAVDTIEAVLAAYSRESKQHARDMNPEIPF